MRGAAAVRRGRVPEWLARRGLRRGAAEEEEAALDQLIAERTTLSRPNTIAVSSPKGGVGKTTCTFLVGSLLAGGAKLRCVAVDANPVDVGTLATLAPEPSRARQSLADVLARIDEIEAASDLEPMVSPLSAGLDLLAAPPHGELMPAITPERHVRLIELLSRFYDVILLDVGASIVSPVAQFVLEEADQNMVVSTPDVVSASTVLGALRYLPGPRLSLVLNRAPRLPSPVERQEIEHELRLQRVHRHATVPDDERLRAMLESGTYDLSALAPETRVSIKQLGLAAAGWLV